MPKRLSYGEEKTRNEMFVEGQLWCSECKQFRPVRVFAKSRSTNTKQPTNYGYRYYCKRCENTRKRNPEKARERYQRRNKGLKAQAVELAGGKCQRCGYDEFAAGFDFHHVYPGEKDIEPMKLVYSRGIEKAWKELDKCCLLCASCHKAYTAGEWRAEFIKRDGLGWMIKQELPASDDDMYKAEKPPEYEQAQIPNLFRPKREAEQLSMFG